MFWVEVSCGFCGILVAFQAYYTTNSMRLHRFYIGGEKGGKNEGFSVFEGNGANRTLLKKKKNLAVVDTSETVALDGGVSEQYASIIHQWKNVFRSID